MATYQGILIRNNLQDTGTIPRTGTWTGCPDIVLAGQATPGDPQATYGGEANYAKDFGGQIVINNVNYIYIRGKNLTNAAIAGKSYLFYSPSGIVLNPQQWTMPQYRIHGSNDAAPPIDFPLAANTVGVTPQPFVWLNPPSPPSGQHFCLITMVGTGEQIKAQYAAAQDVYDYASLGAWMLNNGGCGWRNVVTTSAGSADFSVSTTWTNPGGEATVYLQLVCENLPAGSAVAFSAPVAAEGGVEVKLPKTVVPIPPGGKNGDPNPNFSVGVKLPLPAAYTSAFYYQWYGNGYAKQKGFKMTISPVVVSNGTTDALAAVKHAPSFADVIGDDAHHFHPKRGLLKGLKAFAAFDDDPFGPPTPVTNKGAVIGSHTAELPT